jgi:hypothetical protein
LSADRQTASVGFSYGRCLQKQGPVLVKAAIGALLVLLIFLSVVKLTDRLKPAAKTTALQTDPSLADISAVARDRLQA